MEIIGKDKLIKFKKKHTDCKSQIDAWIVDTETTKYRSFNEIKIKYPSASILKDNKIIFNIKGDRYRLATVVIIIADKIYIDWIGTHEEYNKMNFN